MYYQRHQMRAIGNAVPPRLAEAEAQGWRSR